MHDMMCTRPDVSYALSMTSRYQANPGESHWIAIKNVFKYLRRTKDSFLVSGGYSELRVKGYTDASFQTDRDDLKSQAYFVVIMNGGAVCWRSFKESVIADSITETECIAGSEAAKEAVWIRQFLEGLKVVPVAADPITIYCDNNGVIFQAKVSNAVDLVRRIKYIVPVRVLMNASSLTHDYMLNCLNS
ncbi:secreted RxLR effector protein 161-like [Silene latifolia]|uniref:secreted RxLR effector protein 161-like n=1 Tax=Silene latifolia TaxID=37657 RepID=UPI003D787EB7